jgi:hypothetical protein
VRLTRTISRALPRITAAKAQAEQRIALPITVGLGALSRFRVPACTEAGSPYAAGFGNGLIEKSPLPVVVGRTSGAYHR